MSGERHSVSAESKVSLPQLRGVPVALASPFFSEGGFVLGRNSGRDVRAATPSAVPADSLMQLLAKWASFCDSPLVHARSVHRLLFLPKQSPVGDFFYLVSVNCQLTQTSDRCWVIKQPHFPLPVPDSS